MSEAARIEHAAPPGCQCAHDGSWSTLRPIRPVCDRYTPDGGRDAVCARCEHDERCHG